jgi:hypothetical protein
MTSPTVLAEMLDLDVHDTPICLACLSDVVFALDTADRRSISGAIRDVAPHLWEEGLEQPVQLALRRVLRDGVADAELALRDVELNGASSRIVRAVVLRLALQLRDHARGDLTKMGFHAWPPS